jgi:hypothetical protein
MPGCRPSLAAAPCPDDQLLAVDRAWIAAHMALAGRDLGPLGDGVATVRADPMKGGGIIALSLTAPLPASIRIGPEDDDERIGE